MTEFESKVSGTMVELGPKLVELLNRLDRGEELTDEELMRATTLVSLMYENLRELRFVMMLQLVGRGITLVSEE